MSTKKRIIWETDAENIEPTELEGLLFQSNSVREFLDYNNKHFIVASKGIGKTLLLKSKRYKNERGGQLIGNVDKKDQSIIFIPSSNPYLDFSHDFSYLNKNQKGILENWQNAKLYWLVAIELSVINYYSKKNTTRIKDLANNFPDWIKEIIFSEIELNPSDVLEEMLVNKDFSELNKELLSWKIKINKIFERIVNSAVNVFIDRLDQALINLSKKVWISMQVGLLEAAWDLMRGNNHVKIYCSIRQEAYYNYESPNKLAISGEVTILRYNHDELEDLIDKLSNYYINKDVPNMVGFTTFIHPKTGLKENVTDYIIRHTISRPRDLVVISSSLFTGNGGIDVNDLRRIVNKKSSQEIAHNLFEESSIFLNCLSDKNKREIFLSLIPRNVINQNIIIEVCRRFNNQTNCERSNCKNCKYSHPFCELYNLGLLGIIDNEDVAEGLKNIQKFREPYDISEIETGSLPFDAEIFIIHPCLNDYIKEQRTLRESKSFTINQLISIGNRYPWLNYHTHSYHLSILLDQVSNDELRMEIKELLKKLPYSKDKPKTLAQLKEIIDKFNQGSTLINNVDKIYEFGNKIIDAMF